MLQMRRRERMEETLHLTLAVMSVSSVQLLILCLCLRNTTMLEVLVIRNCLRCPLNAWGRYGEVRDGRRTGIRQEGDR